MSKWFSGSIIVLLVVMPFAFASTLRSVLPYVFLNGSAIVMYYLRLALEMKYTHVDKKVVLGFLTVIGIVFVVLFKVLKTDFIDYMEHQNNWNYPTINSGDIVLIDKNMRGKINRGDIMLYRFNFRQQTLFYAARVAAFGKEIVELKGGSLFVNGAKVGDDLFSVLRYCTGRSDVSPRYAIEGNSYEIPSDMLFVLADNCEVSIDSRHFGPIRKNDVIGVVYKTIWPPSHIKNVK